VQDNRQFVYLLGAALVYSIVVSSTGSAICLPVLNGDSCFHGRGARVRRTGGVGYGLSRRQEQGTKVMSATRRR
jgi:hypothetical protein